MKQNSLHRLIDLEAWSNRKIFLTLLLMTFFLRFPFFFQYDIRWGWDEFTFILMGQSLLDGHLPYTELWEIKPPLTFAAFAFFILLFGKSIVGVRLGGAICVLISAYITFHIGKHIWGRRAGLLAAIFCIFFTSFGSVGQIIYTEIIASVPLMGALAIGVMRTLNPRTTFFIGFLLSIATLVRMNFAYLCVLVGLYILVKTIRSKNFPLRHISMYALGGLIPAVLVSLPYIVSGQSQILFDALVTAPLQYANTQLSSIDALIRLLGKTVQISNAVLWLGFLGGIVLALKSWKTCIEMQKQGLLLLAGFFIGVGFSIINSGAAYFHYIINLIPFMALLAGHFYLFLYQNVSRTLIVIVLLFSLISSATLWGTQRSLLSE